MSEPAFLTERDWQWWFGVSGREAARLVSVQRLLAEAGIDCCPETVVGMSRAVLADAHASQHLRILADLWDGATAAPLPADSGWPLEVVVGVPHSQRPLWQDRSTEIALRCRHRLPHRRDSSE